MGQATAENGTALKRLLPAIALVFALSILVSVLAAARNASVPLGLAAALFALQIVFALARINAPVWQADERGSVGTDWAWDNTVLTAIVYAWGATAMFTIYSLSGLAWRHWWQYGAGMALLACMALVCAYAIRGDGPLANAKSLTIVMIVTAVQTIAVGAALTYLAASGKLHTTKADWAANYVFIAGGITVALISLVSLATHRRFSSTPPLGA